MAEAKAGTGAGEPTAPRRALPAVAALMVGLAVGAGVGIVAGGTLLASWRSGPADRASGSDARGGEGPGAAAPAAEVTYTIDALVVNPADSEATRFLMATLVVVADRAAVVDQLKARDAEVREALLRTLGSKTVAELSDVRKRDALKEELRQALLGVADAGHIIRIHLPQFVIQ